MEYIKEPALKSKDGSFFHPLINRSNSSKSSRVACFRINDRYKVFR